MIYLIHLSEPIGHARHYLGFADDVMARVAQHRATRWKPPLAKSLKGAPHVPGEKTGDGALLLGVANSLGVNWSVVRIWQGNRAMERRLKAFHNAPLLCPICNPDRAEQRARFIPIGQFCHLDNGEEPIPF